MPKANNTVCLVCNVSFYRYPSQIKVGVRVTCSRTCAARHFRDKGTTENCLRCETPFWRTKSLAEKGYGKYCSHNCELLSRHNRDQFAKQRIEMFSWKQKREWMDTKCVRCASVEELQLDHIKPRCVGGKAVRENAQTLCGNCNRRKFWDEEYPLYREVIKQRASAISESSR